MPDIFRVRVMQSSIEIPAARGSCRPGVPVLPDALLRHLLPAAPVSCVGWLDFWRGLSRQLRVEGRSLGVTERCSSPRKRQKMKKDILGDRLAKKIIKKGTVIWSVRRMIEPPVEETRRKVWRKWGRTSVGAFRQEEHGMQILEWESSFSLSVWGTVTKQSG